MTIASQLEAYLVIGIFLGAAMMLFAKTRHLVIYGPNARRLSWVVACIVFFVAAGSISNSSHRRSLKLAISADQPLIQTTKDDPLTQIVLRGEPLSFDPPPVFKADMTTAQKERGVKRYARLIFVEKGKLIDYLNAEGERTTFLPAEEDIAWRASKIAATKALQTEAELMLFTAKMWWFAWIPVLLLGYVSARFEYSNLLRFHGFSRQRKNLQSFGEVEGFVGLLKTACEQSDTNSTLETILSLSDDRRQSMLSKLITDFRDKGAPKELTDAFVCLMDNDVAKKVYKYIQERRPKPAET